MYSVYCIYNKVICCWIPYPYIHSYSFLVFIIITLVRWILSTIHISCNENMKLSIMILYTATSKCFFWAEDWVHSEGRPKINGHWKIRPTWLKWKLHKAILEGIVLHYMIHFWKCMSLIKVHTDNCIINTAAVVEWCFFINRNLRCGLPLFEDENFVTESVTRSVKTEKYRANSSPLLYCSLL